MRVTWLAAAGAIASERPEAASHNSIADGVIVRMRLPSGLKLIALTESSGFARVEILRPDSGSQTEASRPRTTTIRPASGLELTATTPEITPRSRSSPCPSGAWLLPCPSTKSGSPSRASSVQVAASQMRAPASRSDESVTTHDPCGVKLARITRGCICDASTSPVATSQARTSPSSDVVTTRLPSGLNSADSSGARLLPSVRSSRSSARASLAAPLASTSLSRASAAPSSARRRASPGSLASEADDSARSRRPADCSSARSFARLSRSRSLSATFFCSSDLFSFRTSTVATMMPASSTPMVVSSEAATPGLRRAHRVNRVTPPIGRAATGRPSHTALRSSARACAVS